MMASRILGVEICPKTVTNSLESIADSATAWLQRPIEKPYWALMVDGTNFKVRRRGSVEREPSLVVIGWGAEFQGESGHLCGSGSGPFLYA